MSGWLVFSGILLVAGLAPMLYVSSKGSATVRLAALQFAGSVTVLLLVALSVVFGQPSYLVVPLALVLLDFAGTLVFVRLLSR